MPMLVLFRWIMFVLVLLAPGVAIQCRLAKLAPFKYHGKQKHQPNDNCDRCKNAKSPSVLINRCAAENMNNAKHDEKKRDETSGDPDKTVA